MGIGIDIGIIFMVCLFTFTDSATYMYSFIKKNIAAKITKFLALTTSYSTKA